MRAADLGVMALLGLVVLFMVVRPLVRRIVTPEGGGDAAAQRWPARRVRPASPAPSAWRAPAARTTVEGGGMTITSGGGGSITSSGGANISIVGGDEAGGDFQPHLRHDRHRQGAGPGARPVGAEGRRTRREEPARGGFRHPQLAPRGRCLAHAVSLFRTETRQQAGDPRGHRRPDGRACQQAAGQSRPPQAVRPGAGGRADAGARRAIWRQDLQPARRRRTARNLHRDVDARHHRRRFGRAVAAGIRLAHVGLGRPARQLRRHRAPAAAIPADGARRRHHGRDPRPGRPQHVGKARQRAGRGAGELSQERIPADRGGGAVQAAARARRPRAWRSCRRSSRSTSSTAC